MTLLVIVLGLTLFAVNTVFSAPQPGTEAIVGSWVYSNKVRPSRIIVFHADGSWGVRKFDNGPEDIRGRRWRVQDDTLVLLYPSDHGFDTRVDKIVSFTRRKFVTEQQGYKFTYSRIEQPR
jgi:hypothetical protein